MPYVLIRDGIVQAVSPTPVTGKGKTVEVKSKEPLLGKRVVRSGTAGLRVALVCNWDTPCGISTYSKFLADALKPKVGNLAIFSEKVDGQDHGHEVYRVWKRGESMIDTARAIKQWGADFVLLQHEFGIFPKATHFLRFMHDLSGIPSAVMLHSVYQNHLDKTVSTSAIENILVHSAQAKDVLTAQGHGPSIQVIPHGCVVFEDVKPLWNTFQTPYPIVQFGFGFFYKGVDRAIEAVAMLKKNDPKFKDIFYCYLCSQTSTSKNAHADYENYLSDKVNKLGVQDNVAVIQKFHHENIINNYLRTAKLALFPYLTDPANTVYGASGAIRIAMANEIPVIASESHLFDDLENVLPRPTSSEALAGEIDHVFSDEKYRNGLIEKGRNYVRSNTWAVTADRYLEAFDKILSGPKYLRI